MIWKFLKNKKQFIKDAAIPPTGYISNKLTSSSWQDINTHFTVSFFTVTMLISRYNVICTRVNQNTCCLSKPFITVIDTLPLISLKYSLCFEGHFPHHSCHFLKQLWKSSFQTGFSRSDGPTLSPTWKAGL